MVGVLYLYDMKPFEKFLEHSSSLRDLLDLYLELRIYLQEEGFSQEQLERVTHPTIKMMSLREKFINKKNTLFKQIKQLNNKNNKNENIRIQKTNQRRG